MAGSYHRKDRSLKGRQPHAIDQILPVFVNNKRQRGTVRRVNCLRVDALQAHSHHRRGHGVGVRKRTSTPLRQLRHVTILDKRRAAVGKTFGREQRSDCGLRNFGFSIFHAKTSARQIITQRAWRHQISIPMAAHSFHKSCQSPAQAFFKNADSSRGLIQPRALIVEPRKGSCPSRPQNAWVKIGVKSA